MKKVIAVPSLFLLFLMLALLMMSRSTNCGGNSAALAYTHHIAQYARMAIDQRQNDSQTSFESLVPVSSWPEVFRFGWGVKSYWVRKEIEPSQLEPVVVCAQCFGNVPQPTIWNFYRRNPRFAAGFLNNRSKLLDMAEYNSLDFNKYTFIKEEDISNQTFQRTN